MNIIQRQLGHTDLCTTGTYLQGIDRSEIINAIHSRRPPTIPATAGVNPVGHQTAGAVMSQLAAPARRSPAIAAAPGKSVFDQGAAGIGVAEQQRAVILQVMTDVLTLTAVFTPDENGWTMAQLANGRPS